MLNKKTNEELQEELNSLRDELENVRRAKTTLENQTLYDPVTSLPGWSLFEFRFAQAKAYAQRYKKTTAIILLDIRRFKEVNDNLGHAVGNLALVSITDRILSRIRKVDTASRIGGDEFAILLDNLEDEQEVQQAMDDIMNTVSQVYELNGHEVFLGFQMGCAIMPTHSEDLNHIIRYAKMALYQSRKTGKNCTTIFTPELEGQRNNPIELEKLLHQAIKNEEFELFYQAQYDLETKKICGMEALIRWNSPTLGFVSPAEFIPFAEDIGLILPLGEWVLKTACRQNKELQDAGLEPISVGVNLSALQFQQEDLIKVVHEALDETGLSPEYLDLEITESISMQDIENTICTMEALTEMNIQLSIDDFGTGYSSLAYLKRFPLNTLKIDLVFVRNITDSHDDSVIANTIIMMAHNLGFKVIAEGVETQSQADFLRENDCDEIQGYLLSKPLNIAGIKDFLEHPERVAI